MFLDCVMAVRVGDRAGLRVIAVGLSVAAVGMLVEVITVRVACTGVITTMLMRSTFSVSTMRVLNKRMIRMAMLIIVQMDITPTPTFMLRM